MTDIKELIQNVEDAFFSSYPPGNEDADNWQKLKELLNSSVMTTTTASNEVMEK